MSAPPDPWRLGPYVRVHGASLTAGLLAMTARAAVLILAPWPLKYIVDTVLLGHAAPSWIGAVVADPLHHRRLLLLVLSGAGLVLGALDSVLDFTGNRIFLQCGQRIVLAVRRDLFVRLIGLTPEFHKKRRAGELMTRVSEDVQRIQDFVAVIGSGVLPHVITILGMLGVMLTVDWRYALAVSTMAPILIAISARWSGLLRTRMREVRKRDGELYGAAQELLGAVQLIQASGRQQHEAARYLAKARQSLEASLKASLSQAQFPPLVNFIVATGAATLTFYGATLVLAGQISTGTLLVFLAYLRGMVTPARQIAKSAPIFGKTSVALERLAEIFAERPSVTDRPGAVAPRGRPRHLTFDDVSFGFAADTRTLSHISFILERGRTTALVGPSGAGKSTIAALATRFIDPDQGTIWLDGIDLRDLPLAHVRRSIALLAQAPLLLHGTVWENIAYGRPGATRDDAVRAAEAAGIADIIAALPGGFDQIVAERGATLSGGQRQCLAIARAMLADAPMVILDEPTSNLDPGTEARVMAALRRLTHDRATLIIAHRLATIRHADRILVLDGGKIVETGTHPVLARSGGPYAELLRAQMPEAETLTMPPAGPPAGRTGFRLGLAPT